MTDPQPAAQPQVVRSPLGSAHVDGRRFTMPPLPDIGQPDWGEPLNTWLTDLWNLLADLLSQLDGRVTALEEGFTGQTTYSDYRYGTQTTPSPGPGNLRFDTANPVAAANIFVHGTDDGSIDRANLWRTLPAGTRIYIQHPTDSAVWAHWLTTGPAVESAGPRFAVPIAGGEGPDGFTGNGRILVAATTPGPSA